MLPGKVYLLTGIFLDIVKLDLVWIPIERGIHEAPALGHDRRIFPFDEKFLTLRINHDGTVLPMERAAVKHSDVEAAPLFCPGVTAYNAVSKAAPHPGSSLAIFGVGGVGHMVIQFAVLAGADVYAVARSPQHLDLAEELSAHAVDASRGDPVSALAAVGGVDAAVVFAPSDEAMRQAVASIKPGGTVVLGVHAQVGPLPFADEKRVVGSVIGSRQQMREVLALAAAGKVRAHCETYALDAAADALVRLKRGEIRARAVLVPNP